MEDYQQLCTSCNTYYRESCLICKPANQNEFQPFVSQNTVQPFPQFVNQAHTFANFSNGQICYGLDPTQPMVPMEMLQLAPLIPVTLIPVQQPQMIYYQQPPLNLYSPTGNPQVEPEQIYPATQLLDMLSSAFENYLNRFNTNIWYWQYDSSMNNVFNQFLKLAHNKFDACVKTDEEIFSAAMAWASSVGERLDNEPLPPQNYKITSAFINVFDELLKIMETAGQYTDFSDLQLKPEERQGHIMVAKFQACLEYLLRHNFDSHGALENWEFGNGCLEDLKSSVRAFKKTQMFPLSVSILQTHQKLKHSDLKAINSFIKHLKEEYAFWEQQNIPSDRLSNWTEVAWAMAQLIKKEAKTKRKAGEFQGIQHLVKTCMQCLNFLKQESFDNNGETEFIGYDGTRHLQIFCLLFKFKSLPGFCESQSRRETNESSDRGTKVIRYRCKRMAGFGREAYQFGKFWRHIMETGIIDVEGCYFVRDHKPEDKKDKKNAMRKLSGVLFYFIQSTAADSEDLLKLFVAWCEPKFRRNRVFAQYPELYNLQADSLTPEEDLRRSEIRQNMVRKLNSMEPEPRYVEIFVRNKPKKTKLLPTQAEIDEHNELEAAIRETLCGPNRWSDDALQHQKLMYHFTYALKNEDEAAKGKKIQQPSSSKSEQAQVPEIQELSSFESGAAYLPEIQKPEALPPRLESHRNFFDCMSFSSGAGL